MMMSLPKTMKKCGHPINHSNYISFERSSKNVSSIKFESKVSKVMGIYLSEILAFLPEALTNMVKSRVSRC